MLVHYVLRIKSTSDRLPQQHNPTTKNENNDKPHHELAKYDTIDGESIIRLPLDINQRTFNVRG